MPGGNVTNEPLVIDVRGPGPALVISQNGITKAIFNGDGSGGGVARGSGPPAGAYLIGTYVDGLNAQPYVDGVPLLTNDPSSTPNPFPVGRQPSLAKSASFDWTPDLSGYLLLVDTTAGDLTMTVRDGVLTPALLTDLVNLGPNRLLVAADPTVTVTPALPLGVPVGQRARVFCTDVNKIFVDGAVGRPAKPVNALPPEVGGTPRTGQTLSVTSPGGWTGPPTSYAYQWQRNGVDIAGATSPTYPLVVGDEGTTVTCKVTATGERGAALAPAASNGLASQAAAGAAPVNSALPVISGTVLTGSVLTASTGTWTNSPTGYTYQWKRAGANIAGATAATYPLVTADEGTAITCAVTAANGIGSATATSAAVNPPASSGSIGTVLAYDMTSVAYGGASSPNVAEARPNNFNGDWSYRPKIPTSGIAKIADASYPRVQMWVALYEQSGRNPSQARVELADFQTWVQFVSGEWLRGDYSKGGDGNLFPEDWIFNGGVTAGGGSKTAVRAGGGSGASTIVHLGSNPPAGSANPANYLYHGWCPNGYDARSGSGTRAPANIKRIFVACRARLETNDPAAKYMIYAGADKKGPNWENGWEAVIGRGKTVDANWRLFSGTSTNSPLDTGSPYPPTPTGVLSSAEYR